MEETDGISNNRDTIEDDREICDSDDKRRRDFENFDVEEFLARSNPVRRLRKRDLFSAPEFVQRLKPFEEARAGSTVVFECKWKGCPKPSVKWYKDDEEITENPRYSVTEENDGLLKLTIDGACKEDEGAYKVKAENSEGVSSSTGYLSVTGDVSDRPLAAQPRKNLDHSVSFPPHLRTIVEQKSLEEREAEELSNLPPSPIQGYIDSFRRGQTGPLFPGCTEPSYGDDEGESMEQDDEGSDSDTSVESQTFEEELFITEEDDEIQGEACDPLLPRREKPLEISLDYSNIIEPIEDDENISGGETFKLESENSRSAINRDNHIQDDCSTKEDVVEFASEENTDHKLAEDFEEFMKSKRKNVEDIVSHSTTEDRSIIDNQLIVLSSEDLSAEKVAPTIITSIENNVSETSTKLPDIIQTVAVNRDKEYDKEYDNLKSDVRSVSKPTKDEQLNYPEEKQAASFTNIENIVNIDTSTPKTKYSQKTVLVARTELKNTETHLPVASYEENCDLPWLLYLGLASVSSLLASYTNMSPLYYVLAWVAISFLSFQVFIKEERVHAT